MLDRQAARKRMTKTRKVIAGVPFRLAHAGSSAALKSDPAALALVDGIMAMMLKTCAPKRDPAWTCAERRAILHPDFLCVVT